jgi:2-polyprenyl-6-hydroxyphenyl methylase / 3-demethylubiquinone-9 3-methyltransferase
VQLAHCDSERTAGETLGSRRGGSQRVKEVEVVRALACGVASIGVPIDNTLYDRLASTWWEEDENMALLRTGMNPARFGYMRRVLREDLGLDPAGLLCLDVGCGGGLLAEEFAKLGCRLVGVDPSEASLETARAHARQQALEIEYLVAAGEDLPFEDGAFDVVYCCDVLEHVESVERTVAESARVLRPGGVYLYDTINRTRRSRLVIIKLLQEWEATRCMEPDVHDWQMFIKPAELDGILRHHGLEPRGTVGLAPAVSPLALLRNLRRRRRGEISYAELGRRLRIHETGALWGSYVGYAVNPRAAAH